MTTIFNLGTDRSSPLIAGDYLKLNVSIVDEDDAAVNLSGLLAAQYVIGEDIPGGINARVTKTLGSGITVADAASGLLAIVLASGDTNELDGQYRHRLEITDSAGRVTSPFVGRAVIMKQGGS